MSTTIITFLSPNPAASRRLLQRIYRWTAQPTKTTPVALVSNKLLNDTLDNYLLRSSNMLSMLMPRTVKVDSVALPLVNDTILHCLSLDSSENHPDRASDISMKLLAIQSRDIRGQHSTDLILQESRDRLAEILINNSARPSSWNLFQALLTGRVSAATLMGPRNPNLPFFDLQEIEIQNNSINEIGIATGDGDAWNKHGALKEIVIPSFPSATYTDGTSLSQVLQQSNRVYQPMPGLYQLSQGLCIRPLPAAKEDRHLPSPSLIFHTESLQDNYNNADTASFKIGFSGVSGKGQLMLRCKHEKWDIDVRMCAATKPRSMFSEAQESLLASSLQELQSIHVLAHKDTKNQRQDDPNINKMDCWVEFRANMKRPAEYLRKD